MFVKNKKPKFKLGDLVKTTKTLLTHQGYIDQGTVCLVLRNSVEPFCEKNYLIYVFHKNQKNTEAILPQQFLKKL